MINPQDLDLSAMPSLPLDEKGAFPKASAIYFAIAPSGVVQYIGRSRNPKVRWLAHHKFSELSAIDGIRIAFLFADEDLLPAIEGALIKWFDPPLNGRRSIPPIPPKTSAEYSTSKCPEFLAQQKPRYATVLANAMSVRFPESVAFLLHGLPDKAEFIRQAVIEKFERDSVVQMEAIAKNAR